MKYNLTNLKTGTIYACKDIKSAEAKRRSLYKPYKRYICFEMFKEYWAIYDNSTETIVKRGIFNA